jgi:hypothetical protein
VLNPHVGIAVGEAETEAEAGATAGAVGTAYAVEPSVVAVTRVRAAMRVLMPRRLPSQIDTGTSQT